MRRTILDSVFATILAEVVSHVPGALGAIFFDWEGEAVDGFSSMGETNLRLVGAHWGIAYYQAFSLYKRHGLGAPTALSLRFSDQQIIIRRVTDDYLVLMALRCDASSGQALYYLGQAEGRLLEEM